ncbi:MAG: cob(I)yrinic acid a,c-diamide adenosyltransferase [Planctomycetaceae bacterium]
MVHLDRIYTRGGDDGQTSLGDGSRVRKTDPRIIAIGAVDELNALIGVARSTIPDDPVAGLDQVLASIQNTLFDAGADLCLPETDGATEPTATGPLRMTAEQVSQVESIIDSFNGRLEPLASFVLPGGTPVAVALHQARTVCRRAEIEVLRLAEQGTVNDRVAVYLNRLSDLLFVLARTCNSHGQDDVLWVPGKDRG